MNPWDLSSRLGGACPVCGQEVELVPAQRLRVARPPDAERTPVRTPDPEATPELPHLEGTCVRCSSRLLGFDGRIMVASRDPKT
jgi:hypothetical protein